jgi:SpoVK/Ycf46/Vps4 family AAA+-type ATPase
MRVTAGTIRSAARGAWTEAQLAGRSRPEAGDVSAAMRRLEADGLETLATRVHVAGGWNELAIEPETRAELRLLEQRCRERERLGNDVGVTLRAGLNPGVRALLSGPSGTGKTLAARLLAAALGKELFTVDLAAVVNKYLGETEKSLDAVFSRAEALDVVLLLDEGDALMTRRTDVQTSNDRYANLETNFLLQRLDAYEGIFLVTTNAGERIDGAFRRRLDVVIEFRAPAAAERWSIWLLHLPDDHVLPGPFLEEVAVRCSLSGGQIRNAVLHATLLATVERRPLGAADVEDAVRREYRKTGAVCPLRTGAAVGA